MKLKELLTEKRGFDFTKKFAGKKHKELKLPVYTKHKYDYGDASNNLETTDALLKASDSGNIYGRRPITQRSLKKRK